LISQRETKTLETPAHIQGVIGNKNLQKGHHAPIHTSESRKDYSFHKLTFTDSQQGQEQFDMTNIIEELRNMPHDQQQLVASLGKSEGLWVSFLRS
jgi:hypothetical protein